MNTQVRRLALLALLAGAGPAAAYETALPLRGDALGPDVYLRTGGHGTAYGNEHWAIDFHAASWDGSEWQRSNGPANEDHYLFGAPLYAPEDGWVVACWRTAPDKPSPDENYDFDGDGKDDESPLGRGNHIQLLNADGTHMIFLGHLRDNSIPTSICPLPAARDQIDAYTFPGLTFPVPDGWPDDLSIPTCGISGWDAFPAGTVLPTPVWVEKGQYLGDAGHSGRSGVPHLHMQIKPAAVDASGNYCVGAAEEMLFSEAWSAECNRFESLDTPWTRLDEDNPLQPWALGGSCEESADCMRDERCFDSSDKGLFDGTCAIPTPTQCFLPDAFGPQADLDYPHDPASNLHLVTDANGATLVYQSDGDLRLRSFNINSSGVFTELDTQYEGAVLDVAAARPLSQSRDVVVSIRGSNGLLKHIPYSVDNGGISRMYGKEQTDGTVYQVDSTPSPAHSGFVVAVETSSGNLKVIDYDVDTALNIERQQPSWTGDAIHDVAITTTTGFDGVVTAELRPTGQLVLRSFAAPASGGVTPVDTQISWVVGSSVRAERVGVFISEFVITSVILLDGTLRLDAWKIDGNGEITWHDTISAGVVSDHDLVSVGGGDLVSAVRDSDDNYRMIGWKVDWLTGELRRTATRVFSEVTEAAIGIHGSHLVSAQTHPPSGALMMYSWGENFISGY